MLLEDFQVGVVLYAEREGRSQISKQHIYMYTLCFYSPLEKSIKATRSVKKKRKRKKKTYELLATKCTDGFGLGCFHGSSIGVDFGTGSSCVGLFLLAMDAVFLGDGHLVFFFGFAGGGWCEEMRRFLGESQTMVVVVVCDEGRAEADCVQCSRYRKKRVDSIVSGRREVK